MIKVNFSPPRRQDAKKSKKSPTFEKFYSCKHLYYPARCLFRKHVFRAWLGGLGVSAVNPSFSQTISSTASLITPLSALGASARADALGSAFTGVADDPSALFFNGAGLSGLTNARLSLNHNSYLGGSFEETLLVGLPAGDLGGFAGAIQYVLWGGLEVRGAFAVSQGTFDGNY